MPYLPERFSEHDIRWIYDAIRAIAAGQIADDVLADLGAGGFEEVAGIDPRSGKAAQILSWIALEAIDALESLPAPAQASIAEESEAWPVVVRPKVSTALQQIKVQLEALRFAEKLELDLHHSAGSDAGPKVPVAESCRPGIGLAKALHGELLKTRKAWGLDGYEFPAPPGVRIEGLSPLAFLGMLQGDPKPVGGVPSPDGKAHHKIKKAGVGQHLILLLGNLRDLDIESAPLWAMAGLRLLQYLNDGALVHDVQPDRSDLERLSPAIPLDYWNSTKIEVANSGVNALRRLEARVLDDLNRGFRALAKS